MNGYRLEKSPFFTDSGARVSVFKGMSEEVVQPMSARKFDCTRGNQKATVLEMNKRLNEGLVQSRLDFQHAAKLLELRIDIADNSFSVVHVMEPLEKSIITDIEERKRFTRRITEAELRTFLWQTARALFFSHSKGIPHGDFKLSSVFLCEHGTYKITDFGSFGLKKLQTGSPAFPSPQARAAFGGASSDFDAFKADVFALGASSLHLANLVPPTALLGTENLDAVVASEVASLGYSEDLKSLLQDMLKSNENARVTITEVVDRLTTGSVQSQPSVKTKPKVRLLLPAEEEGMRPTSQRSPNPSPHTPGSGVFASSSPVSSPNPQLAFLSKKHVRLFNFEVSSWGPISNLEISIEYHKDSVYTFIGSDRLFCCGGFGSGNTSYIIQIAAEHSRVQVLPEMNEGRGYPGIVPYRGAMYVFAGATLRDHSRTGEMIDLEMPNLWVMLEGQMQQGRHNFAACVFRHKAYLSSGYGARTVELYDLVKRRFEEGPDLVLPQTEGCAVWMHAGQMTIISKKSVSKIDFRETNPVAQTQAHAELEISPNTNPAVSGHSVFWVQGDFYIRVAMNRTVIQLEKFSIT